MLGGFLRDVIDAEPRRTSVSSAPTRPPPTGSTTSSRSRTANLARDDPPTDEQLAPEGRVMEVLSEHLCQGWLEGYLLTGRHGLFTCYEAFIHIVDSMFNQHAKWLKTTRSHPVAPADRVAELPAHARTSGVRTTTASRHQDPGFIDHVVNKKAEVIRVYLPPDANTLLSVADHCLRSRNYVNVIVAGKQPALAVARRWTRRSGTARAALGIWEWAVERRRATSRTSCSPAAATCRRSRRSRRSAILREQLPDLKVRVVNVVDLMRLQPRERAPARAVGRRVRRALHRRPAGHLRLPRLSLADPPAHLPAHEPRQPPRARLQGGGHDHDAVRHGRCSTTSTATTS